MDAELTRDEEWLFKTEPKYSDCLLKAYNSYIETWYAQCEKAKGELIECKLPEQTAEGLNSNYRQVKANCIK